MDRKELVTAYPVTAYAMGNALGSTTSQVIASLAAGISGLRPCTQGLPFTTFAGEFAGELARLAPTEAAYDSRLARMALTVMEEIAPAVSRATMRWGKSRVALVLGTSTGGILETEHAYQAYLETGGLPASYDFDRQHAFHGLVELLKLRTGINGPGFTVSTACSSSAKIFGTARRLLDARLADAVLLIGVDTLCQLTLRGFRSLEVLSTKPCRPFGLGRDGTTIGEGAALLLMERDGHGPARLLGVGESCDAHHMSHPHPDGLGAKAAMAAALAQAAVGPEEIDHINAHGTATVLNDAAESKAIADLLGTSVPVVSTKGYTGHLLGAAGATEAILSIVAIEQGWIPVNLGAQQKDPAIPINVNQEKRAWCCKKVLSNSFAFGGNNASLLWGAA